MFKNWKKFRPLEGKLRKIYELGFLLYSTFRSNHKPYYFERIRSVFEETRTNI